MKTEIEESLTLVYEIEGLLTLLQHRDMVTLPPSVKTLLSEKSARLAKMLAFGVDTQVQEEVEDFEKEKAMEKDEEPLNGQQEDGERLAETVEYEQEEDSQPDAGNPQEDLTKVDIAQAEEDEADTESVEIDQARHDYYGEIARKRTLGSKLMQRFTLNDRFRFTRELFGGSTTAFNTIIEEISTFENLHEVRKYLAEKQGIDITSGAGKEFINTIGASFQ